MFVKVRLLSVLIIFLYDFSEKLRLQNSNILQSQLTIKPKQLY